MKGMQKIVIKVGSSTLMQGTDRLSRRFMLGLAQQITDLKSRGLELLLVSSGAQATGRELLSSIDRSSFSKQAFTSVGQIKLMQTWSELFSLLDLQVGQVLLSKEDFSTPNCLHTKESLNSMLQQHLLPIINENDAIASRIGDNDNLAALVACLIGADAVILLTDQEGLYTADPRHHPNATLIPVVDQIDQAIVALASGTSTCCGTGGMKTKIEAAQVASRAGIKTFIVSSARPNVLIDLIEGMQVGTLFLAQDSKYHLSTIQGKQTV
jgi:glutamate 5-kinase